MAKDKQVSEEAFLKSFNKKKAAMKAASKEERPSGYLDDAAIANRLGLAFPEGKGERGDPIVLNATFSKGTFGFAKDDANRPMFMFMYSLTENSPHSNKGKGTILSNNHIIEDKENASGDVWQTEEEAAQQLCFDLQALGYDTSGWSDPIKETVSALKELTKEKPALSLKINTYKSKKGSTGLSFEVVDLHGDNSDLDEDEETPEDTEEESVDEDTEEVDVAEWVDNWVTWTDDDGSVDFKVTAYDEDAGTFTGTDEDGEEYEASVDECEWAEDQRD